MHTKSMVLLNVKVGMELVGFGILVCEVILFCFDSFFFFLKFHTRKGKFLYMEPSSKEKFPLSPISVWLLSARNSKLFPFIGCFTQSSAGPALCQDHQREYLPSRQVKAEGLYRESIHENIALL